MSYTYPKSIEEAAQLLDQVKPGWEKLIDQNKLFMGSSLTCILGQLYENWDSGFKTLFHLETNVYIEDSIFGMSRTEDSWTEQINQRLNMTKSMNFLEALKHLKEKTGSANKLFLVNDVNQRSIYYNHYDWKLHWYQPQGGGLVEDKEMMDLVDKQFTTVEPEKILHLCDLKPGDKFMVDDTRLNGKKHPNSHGPYTMMERHSDITSFPWVYMGKCYELRGSTKNFKVKLVK